MLEVEGQGKKQRCRVAEGGKDGGRQAEVEAGR